MRKSDWAEMFFNVDFKVPYSLRFRLCISMKLAEAVLEYTGINVQATNLVLLDGGRHEFEILESTGYFKFCRLYIDHEVSPRMDWSYSTKSGKLITPTSEEFEKDDLVVKIEALNKETFLNSYFAKPLPLPFSIKKYHFPIEIRRFCNDPLKLRVKVADDQYIQELIASVDNYVLFRIRQIENGKVIDSPVHNIRLPDINGDIVVFDFDFGMAGPKTLKGIFDVFNANGRVESVVVFSYDESFG